MKNIHLIAPKILFSISTILIISSCNNTRFLEEGQELYTGSSLKIEGDSISKKDKNELEEQLKKSIVP